MKTLRMVLAPSVCNPSFFFHRPVMVTDPHVRFGQIIRKLKAPVKHPEDDVVDLDIVLIRTRDVKRVLTGADILGRLLRGISVRDG